MKEWWKNLELREKRIVSLGGACVIVLLLYVLLWSPLSNKVDALRTQVASNQKLLAWMQDADKHIQELEKTAQQKPTARTTGSLLGIVQKQINGTSFVSALNRLHQVDNDSVQLIFQNVNFDSLMKWLIAMTEQQGLTVTQASVTPSATPGVVTVEVVLRG